MIFNMFYGSGGGSEDLVIVFVNPFSTNTYYDIVQCKVGDTVTYSKTAPTKAADSQYTYKFSGWNTVKDSTANTGILTSVESSMVLYPQFTRTAQSYAITWKDYDGSTLKTTYAEYGQTPTYGGNNPSYGGWTFSGWNPTPKTATGAATYYATYSLPAGMSETISKSWTDIIADSSANRTSGYSTGQTKVMLCTGKKALCYELAGINLDSAGHFAFVSRTIDGKTAWSSTGNNTGGYPSSLLKTYIEGTCASHMPANIKNAMKTVTKYCVSYNPSNKNLSYTAKLWAPSNREIMFHDYENQNLNGWAETTGPQYTYYDDRSKSIRYTDSGQMTWAWLSTTHAKESARSLLTYSHGDTTAWDISESWGALPCFVL